MEVDMRHNTKKSIAVRNAVEKSIDAKEIKRITASIQTIQNILTKVFMRTLLFPPSKVMG